MKANRMKSKDARRRDKETNVCLQKKRIFISEHSGVNTKRHRVDYRHVDQLDRNLRGSIFETSTIAHLQVERVCSSCKQSSLLLWKQHGNDHWGNNCNSRDPFWACISLKLDLSVTFPKSTEYLSYEKTTIDNDIGWQTSRPGIFCQTPCSFQLKQKGTFWCFKPCSNRFPTIMKLSNKTKDQI